MAIKIILFGQLTDIAGAETISLGELKDTDELRAELHRIYPSFAGTEYRIAINKNIVSENTSINNNSTIALLPPFSGG